MRTARTAGALSPAHARRHHAGASRCDDFLPNGVQSNEFRTILVLVMAADCLANCFSQSGHVIRLGEDGCTERTGGQPALRTFLNKEKNLVHGSYPRVGDGALSRKLPCRFTDVRWLQPEDS
jgi:hypothetical protein